MASTSPPQPAEPGPGIRPGVMDAVGRGWELLTGDFWNLWLLGLATWGLMLAAGFIPFGAVVFLGPLLAGVYYTIGRRIDGGTLEIGHIFEGFRQRFGQAIVAMLPYCLAAVTLASVVGLGSFFAFLLPVGLAATAGRGEEEALALGVGLGVVGFVLIYGFLLCGLMVLYALFLFAPLTVWDHPESGWEAAKASARLAWDHIWGVIGFLLLFWLIALGAAILGCLALCIGVFFTTPVVIAWQHAATVYLYRSWTGHEDGWPVPGVEPPGGEASGPEGGPPPLEHESPIGGSSDE